MNGNDIVSAIQDFYFNKYNGEFRSHLGASMGGDPCLRKLWYSFRWATMVLHEGRMQRLFQRGHREEPFFAQDLRDIGINVLTEDENGNQYRMTCPTNFHIGGSCDGFGEVRVDRFNKLNAGEWVLVEMKTHNEKSFKKLQANGVRATKPLHYSQMNLYMKWAGLTKALYISVNKNNDDLYVEIIDYDQANAEQSENNMIFVVEADSAPEKLHQDMSRFECKYCDYNDICHKDKFYVEVNCRTCVFSKANPDATWTCRKGDFKLDNTVMPAGCNGHIFQPSLLESISTVSSADPNNEWLEFEFLNGTKIKNGQKDPDNGVYNSTELRTIIAKGYQVYDESYKYLEEAFDAQLVTV